FLSSTVTRLDKLLGAVFLTSLFSNQTPNLPEAYYWMVGSITYQLGCILLLFFFTTVLKSDRKSGGMFLLLSLLAGILIVAIAGSNEVLMLLILLTVVLIAMLKVKNRSRDKWRWVAYALITLICVAIVISAPGNVERASLYPNRHRFWYSLAMSSLQEMRFLVIWISNPAFIFATILFVPIAGRLAGKITLVRRLQRHSVLCAIGLLLIVFLGFFPPYWATGVLGQHRTVNTV